MKTRTLKVGELWRSNGHRDTFFPKINLQGKWLREAGFATGDEVYIILDEPGRLVVITSRDYTEEDSHDYDVPKLQVRHGDSLRNRSDPTVQQLQLL
jgi:hypothetical protein